MGLAGTETPTLAFQACSFFYHKIFYRDRKESKDWKRAWTLAFLSIRWNATLLPFHVSLKSESTDLGKVAACQNHWAMHCRICRQDVYGDEYERLFPALTSGIAFPHTKMGGRSCSLVLVNLWTKKIFSLFFHGRFPSPFAEFLYLILLQLPRKKKRHCYSCFLFEFEYRVCMPISLSQQWLLISMSFLRFHRRALPILQPLLVFGHGLPWFMPFKLIWNKH